MFPGKKVGKEGKKIIDEIIHQLNPQKIAHFDLKNNWIRIDNEVYKLGFFKVVKYFYLFYKHPVHDYLDKLFISAQEELLSFLKNHIDPEKGEGVDVIIASSDLSHIIVCNHDGEIYLASVAWVKCSERSLDDV